MYKHLLESVENINYLAIIPLAIFFLFFIATVIYAMRKNKSYIEKMGNMPLDETNN